jgi:hypothetical protein
LLNGIQQFKEVAHTCLLRKSAAFGNHIGYVVYGSGGSGGSELGPLHPPGRFWVRSRHYPYESRKMLKNLSGWA